MRHATIFRYSIPFSGGAVLRDAQPKTRDGLILRLTEDRREGWGEAAPLPKFSRESLAQAETDLRNAAQRWLEYAAPPEDSCPSAAFASSCAQAELDGVLPEARATRGALLCDGDLDTFIARLRASSNIALAKLKIGRDTPEREGERINLLLSMFPYLRLRLDANRVFTLDEARRFAQKIALPFRARIDFIEEPCVDSLTSLAFAQETAIAIAWDESARETGFVVQAVSGVAAIVVKPTLTGSIAHCRALCDAARRQKLSAVISSSIESTLGLTQLARLAAWLTPETPHGLDTAHLLGTQVLRRWRDCETPKLDIDDLEERWRA
ncbi:MAG: o-succinylbenzoate synthase [Burkholderiales bacterium]|jgi:O-succinylbenzoate synthase|nr:o-succinylbenzoate synthase [Burkholderiales bacterium]